MMFDSGLNCTVHDTPKLTFPINHFLINLVSKQKPPKNLKIKLRKVNFFTLIYKSFEKYNCLTSCWSWFWCQCPPRWRLLRRRPWFIWPWWGLLRSGWWWLGPPCGYGLLSLAGDRGGIPWAFRSHLEKVGRRLIWSLRSLLLEAVWGCRGWSWSRSSRCSRSRCRPPWWCRGGLTWGPEAGGGLYWCMRCVRSNMSWALLTTESLCRLGVGLSNSLLI